jgi:hypothetical protein
VKGSRANQPFLDADHRKFFAPLSKMVSIRLSPTEYRFVRNRFLLVFAIQAANDPAVAHVSLERDSCTGCRQFCKIGRTAKCLLGVNI